MKIILTFLLIICCSFSSFTQVQQSFIPKCKTAQISGIYGQLTENGNNDPADNSPILAANVMVYSNGKIVISTVTDFDGNYFVALTHGQTYTIEFWYLGFEKECIENITIAALLELNTTLKESFIPPSVAYYPKYNLLGDGFSSGQTLDNNFIRNSPL